MEVFVRGARSSSRDWLAAQSVPLSELPQLNAEQKAEARRGNVPENAFARTLYAQQLTGQATLQRLLSFGRWLEAKIAGMNPDCKIDSVELTTWDGVLHIQGKNGYDAFSFDLNEDVVERFLTTGAADLETAILRVAEIFVPHERIAKAS
jgi:hypothetical protein